MAPEFSERKQPDLPGQSSRTFVTDGQPLDTESTGIGTIHRATETTLPRIEVRKQLGMQGVPEQVLSNLDHHGHPAQWVEQMEGIRDLVGDNKQATEIQVTAALNVGSYRDHLTDMVRVSLTGHYSDDALDENVGRVVGNLMKVDGAEELDAATGDIGDLKEAAAEGESLGRMEILAALKDGVEGISRIRGAAPEATNGDASRSVAIEHLEVQSKIPERQTEVFNERVAAENEDPRGKPTDDPLIISLLAKQELREKVAENLPRDAEAAKEDPSGEHWERMKQAAEIIDPSAGQDFADAQNVIGESDVDNAIGDVFVEFIQGQAREASRQEWDKPKPPGSIAEEIAATLEDQNSHKLGEEGRSGREERMLLDELRAGRDEIVRRLEVSRDKLSGDTASENTRKDSGGLE